MDLHQQIKQTLREKERFSQSKAAAKKAKTSRSGIYSHDTARAYNRNCQRFANYVEERSPQGRYTSLEDAKQYAAEYIARENEDRSRSPSTVKAERSALAKLFGCRGRDLGEVADRKRAEITRSRESTVISPKTGKEIKNTRTRYGRFSERNHPDLVNWARGTGMRRYEMEHVRGDQFYVSGTDGSYWIRVIDNQGKGGRVRDIPVRGDAERIREMCVCAGHDKVFMGDEQHKGVPDHMDVHRYRSQYATNLYNELARPLDQIPKNERYWCRGDLKGVCYDRAAMLAVSEALGHSRVSVIAAHYLR